MSRHARCRTHSQALNSSERERSLRSIKRAHTRQRSDDGSPFAAAMDSFLSVTETSLARRLPNGKGTLMYQDSKTLAVLTAPLHQQVAVLNISTHLSCVAAAARRKVNGVSARYLRLLITLAILFV
jgi:hypothetical protein